jgi:signal transduction histidine kinase
VTIGLALAALAWLGWTARAVDGPVGAGGERSLAELWAMALAGAVLTAASPSSAASAFVFVAVVAAGIRVELRRAVPLVVAGAVVLVASELIYDGSALGTLAYTLGFAAAVLAASNSRSSVVRAEQAELLLAQAQRSHEEQVRAARLEESTRIAREIHDVLAHTLAGLAIQLEATASLVEHDADREPVLARVRRAHELARQGLVETRRAVGALRGEPDARDVTLRAGLEALVEAHRATSPAAIELAVEGRPDRLGAPAREAVLRVAQEALTNARKHAPGAAVEVLLDAGRGKHDPVLLAVTDDGAASGRPPASSLAASGGGYGVAGMRERAEQLSGTLFAGRAGDGWRVELRLPSERTGARDPEPVA